MLTLLHICNLFGAEKTMTATDVTGFDAIFSTGFFATFSRFEGARLTKLDREPGEKAKNPVESLQWRRRPEIADFCPLSWSNVSWLIAPNYMNELLQNRYVYAMISQRMAASKELSWLVSCMFTHPLHSKAMGPTNTRKTVRPIMTSSLGDDRDRGNCACVQGS